jgi:predicted dehydrogenase
MGKARKDGSFTRRGFLRRTGALAAAAVGFPHIVPGSALGLNGATAPSNRITIGFIGVGKMAKGHVGSFLGDPTVQVLAICDVERGRREGQARRANEHYTQRNGATYTGCDTYHDFRDLCARPDIDAVVICTPNQWHALNAVEAARQGKDIYLEKPFARTVDEGKAIVKAVRRYGRILQVGSQQRSDSAFRTACEIVRNGRIGTVREVFVNIGAPPEEDYLQEDPVPEGLDWDLWLGPCPWRPYSAVLAPPESYDGWPAWRYYRPYAGGSMTDFGAHHFDIAQWGLGMDGSGPVKVIPPADEAAGDRLTYEYANGIRMYRGGAAGRAAVEFVGDLGRVRVNRGQYLETDPPNLQYEPFGPGDLRLYESNNHKDNWLDCIRTRREPICNPEIGQSTAATCHIGNIAYWLKRPLQWNPDTQTFVDDAEANRLLSRPMRAPWQLEA